MPTPSNGQSASSEGTLFTRTINTADLALPFVAGSGPGEGLVQQWRRDFSLTLIDAPPVGSSAAAEILSATADGVVLVVEAEKARWQAVPARGGRRSRASTAVCLASF